MRLPLPLLLAGFLSLSLSPVPAGTSSSTKAMWDTAPETWAATDDLGRSLPTHEEAGPPRPDKFVGIFYFLWLGEHGTDGPYDVTKILARDPKAITDPNHPLWGPMHAYHHWGEPLFGYYLSDDEWVLRKHAQMLSDAGVDTLIFDVTNQFTYPESYRALCRVFTQIRKEGGRTPQIAFLTPFWDPSRVVETLYRDLYEPGHYSDLWFRWKGKPLILADPSLIRRNDLSAAQNTPAPLKTGQTLGQTFRADRPFTAVGGRFPTWNTTRASVRLTLYRDRPGGRQIRSERALPVSDNAWVFLHLDAPLPAGTYYLEATEPAGTVGWWSHSEETIPSGQAYADGNPIPGDRTLSVRYADEDTTEILKFFTSRKPNPDYFRGLGGPNEWAWLEVYPQHIYYSTPGVPEQMTVSVAQNAVGGKLGVLSNPRAHGRSFHNGKQPPLSEQDFTGRNFAEQASRALEVDPAFVFITGWNEWIAGRFPQDAPFAGTGPVSFVDQFDHEYSRDIEPVKGGHADSYYYQMVDFIRRYKGVRKPEPPSPPRTLRIGGGFQDWRGVRPEYRDDRGDTARRSHRGWGREGRYRNETGRNDFTLLKLAQDRDRLYFYARTREPLILPESDGGLMLFLDADRNSKTGWEGYDFRLNLSGIKEGKGTLERSAGGWAWEAITEVQVYVKGSEMELSVPRSALNLSKPLSLDFKWIDIPQFAGDILSTYTDGDTAPNGRFRYRYRQERIP